MKVYLYYIGRARDARANGMAEEFVKRTSRYAACQMREIRPDRFDLFDRHPTARKVLLDPAGECMDSAQFTSMVRQTELAALDLVFLVGGHDGLPQEWKERPGATLLSLSPMTFPHELARAIVAEQIYRAFTTLRGHPYPR